MDCTPAFRPGVVWLDLIEEVNLIVALGCCGSICCSWFFANCSYVVWIEAVAVRALLLEGIVLLAVNITAYLSRVAICWLTVLIVEQVLPLAAFVFAGFRARVARQVYVLIAVLNRASVLVKWSGLIWLSHCLMLILMIVFGSRTCISCRSYRLRASFVLLGCCSSDCVSSPLVNFKRRGCRVLLIKRRVGLRYWLFLRPFDEWQNASTAHQLAFKARIYYLAHLQLLCVFFDFTKWLKGGLLLQLRRLLLHLFFRLLARLNHLRRPVWQTILTYIQLGQFFDLLVCIECIDQKLSLIKLPQ